MATPTTLPASFTSGQILTAANMNDIRGAFRILQVVQGTTSTEASSSSTSYADTGLTATITPSATSNKILVVVAQAGITKSSGNAANALNLKLLRGVTEIQRIGYSVGYTGTALSLFVGTLTSMYLDSPASTSALTYKTTFSNDSATASVAVQRDSIPMSTITLMEISA